MSTTPPGWYPDQQGQQRYWDGQQWTDHVAPAQPGGPPQGPGQAAAAQPQSPAGSGASGLQHPLLLVALAFAAVAVAGNFVAWASLGDVTASGIDGSDGKIVIGLMAAAVLLLVVGAATRAKGWFIGSAIFAALAVGVGVLNIQDISDRGLDLEPGVFMVTVGAFAFAWTSGALMRRVRR